jgi:hypothetical protein
MCLSLPPTGCIDEVLEVLAECEPGLYEALKWAVPDGRAHRGCDADGEQGLSAQPFRHRPST